MTTSADSRSDLRFMRWWMVSAWLVGLPVIWSGNWMSGRYGGAHYPLWILVALWLLISVLSTVLLVVAARDDR